MALLSLLTAVFFGLLVNARRMQTRRRLQWLQKQRTTGYRVGLDLISKASKLLEGLERST